MEYYETQDDYNGTMIGHFTQWFNKEIGTDHEVNDSASGIPNEFYILFFELTDSEVRKIRAYEIQLNKELETL